MCLAESVFIEAWYVFMKIKKNHIHRKGVRVIK